MYVYMCVYIYILGRRYFVHLLRDHFLFVPGGVIPRSSSVPVYIAAVGDSKPQFIPKTYNASVEEEIVSPVEVTRVRMTILCFIQKARISNIGFFFFFSYPFGQDKQYCLICW